MKSSTRYSTLNKPNKFSSPRKRLKIKPRVVEEDNNEQVKLEFSKEENRIALTLMRMYVELRKVFSGEAIPTQVLEGHRSFKHFETLARNMLEHQKKTKLRVDKIAFLYSHFVIWEEATWPSRLIGKNSWEIYRKFREAQNYTVHTHTSSTESQQSLLKYLAESRDESESETMKKLAHSGLFTEDFVSSWKELRMTVIYIILNQEANTQITYNFVSYIFAFERYFSFLKILVLTSYAGVY